MAWIHKLRNLARTDRLNREIEREMAFHVAEKADALRAQGMSEADALREARRRLGSPVLHRERTRDADVVTWLDSFLRDVRHAVRGLRRAPLFAFVAVMSLALGIGANTAIFTLIDAVVLRPLSVPAPDELVTLAMYEPEQAGTFTNPLWEQIRDRATGLSPAAAFADARLNTSAGGEARRIAGSWVSGEYFALFGVRPALGRLLTVGDDVRGCTPVAVLGHGFWQSEYGADPTVLGRTILLDATSFEIVGVAQAGFRGAQVGRDTQVYLPLCAQEAMLGERSFLDARSTWWLTVMGRRPPDVTMAQLAARVAAIASPTFEATVPEHYPVSDQEEYRATSLFVRPAPAGISPLRDRYAGALVMLMAGVGLILLIACANVANLLLARATARQREFAIRVAIGAGRARIARQLLVESILFAVLGAAIGLLFARFGAYGLVALIGDDGIALDLGLNARVLAFTSAIAMLTALLFGMVPAWRAGRVDPHTTMTAHGRSIADGHGSFTFGKALVAGQVALSLVLLVGAGLLVGSLRNLTTLDPGFEPDGVVIATADVRPTGFESDQIALARQQLVDRLRATPGVLRASAAERTPIQGMSWNQPVVVEGFTPASREDGIAWFNAVSDDYFATFGTPILAGRDFNSGDVAGGEAVAIVNRAVARKFFGTDNPVGRRFSSPMGDDPGETYTVVGVVGDAKYRSLREENSETVYLAASQATDARPFLTIAARRDGDPAALLPVLREAFAEVHPAIVVEFRTLSAQVEASLQRERMLAVLSALFGIVALALAMLGLYGVMSYAVAQRRNEIGVRIAIGADRGRVVRMVLGDVGRVLVIGLLVGVAGAAAATRLVASFLYGLEPGEPVVLAGAAGVLMVVALGAGLAPAWRAARMDPTLALREE